MTPIAPPKPIAPLSLERRAPEPAPKAEHTLEVPETRAEEPVSPPQNEPPSSLQVKLDEAAGRFVQTWSDATTHETLRRYPSDAQLAYSRAVMAYLRAITNVNAK